MIKDFNFDVAKELKTQACHPILKSHHFKRKGIVWFRELPNNMVYIVTSETSTIIKNDFVFSLHYGIYYKGVHEFLYEFPFELKHAYTYCIYKGLKDKKNIKGGGTLTILQHSAILKALLNARLRVIYYPILNHCKLQFSY